MVTIVLLIFIWKHLFTLA